METGKSFDINKYKNNIMNSPLLSGDVVEIKDYSIGNKTTVNPTKTVPTNQVNQPKVEVNKNFSFSLQGDGNKTQEPVINVTETPLPNPEQVFDNVDPMAFIPDGQSQGAGSKPGDNEGDNEEKELSQSASLESAAMLINLYTSMVPPIIAKSLKTNVMDFGTILKGNNQIPNNKISEIQRFLLLKNEEIEKALKLSREQTMLLKHALAEVLKRYNLQPENPVVNLIIVVIGIGVGQFLAIRQIMAAQTEYLTNFIKEFSVTIPEGVSNPLLKKVRLQVKKYSEAA